MKAARRPLLIAAAATAALTATVWLWSHNAQPSQQDIQTMKTFTENMTTHCVGRFLIDAPKGADISQGNYGFQIAEIKPIQESAQPVEDRLRRLDRELAARVAAQATWKSGYGKQLDPAQAFGPRPDVRSVWYGKPDSDSKHSNQMDGFVVRPGGTYVFETSAYDQTHVKEFNDFLTEIAPTLSVRENSSIPTVAGYCMNGGFIAMNPKRGESTGWGWDLPGRPDVSFGFGTTTNDDKVRMGQLDQEGATLKDMGNLVKDMKTIRKRRFDLNGVAAQEWSVEFTDVPQYEFSVEIPGAPNDNARPFIRMSMRVGDAQKKIKPSLSKGEAIALWDAVIQSLRLRPGAV